MRHLFLFSTHSTYFYQSDTGHYFFFFMLEVTLKNKGHALSFDGQPFDVIHQTVAQTFLREMIGKLLQLN